MKKSDGILSLKKAAKLLNKHSPEGEKLAYINPEEAKLLRSHGGSGIMTLAGVPSYWDWGETWETIKNIAQPVTNWLGYTGGQGGGQQLMKDIASLWGGYEGMKESKELSEFQKQQYQEQKDKEALNQLLFSQQTDSGAQLLAPTNVPTSVEDISVFKEATGIPSLKTTAVAEGGRIGYRGGGDMAHRLSELIKKSNAGTITPQEEHEMEQLEIMLDYGPGEAQGGRIGAFNGGIQGLMPQQGPAGFMPQQGMMPQPGLMPQRLGFEFGSTPEEGDIGFEEEIIHPGTLDEGDIGIGGQPLGTYEHEGALTNEPTSLEQVVELAQAIALPFNPYHIWDTMQKAGASFKEAIEIVKNTMGGETEVTEEVTENKPPEWADDFLEKLNKGEIELPKQNYENEMMPFNVAQGGRIGAQGGGIMPLLDLGGMEKDYRQDGGFVPIGRKEKADDVPATLSKNEFVFTADAVKAAGGGDIDEGAQRMYNVMKNLEAGGQISEQSQGQA